jgi:hypothetical protein
MKKSCQPNALKKVFVTKTLEVLLPVCGLFLLLALLYQSIASFTFNSSNYPTEPVFSAMAKELIQYLSGHLPSLSLFTEQETAHMIDVLHLFQLGKWVSYAAIALFLFVVPAAWIKKVCILRVIIASHIY